MVSPQAPGRSSAAPPRLPQALHAGPQSGLYRCSASARLERRGKRVYPVACGCVWHPLELNGDIQPCGHDTTAYAPIPLGPADVRIAGPQDVRRWQETLYLQLRERSVDQLLRWRELVRPLSYIPTTLGGACLYALSLTMGEWEALALARVLVDQALESLPADPEPNEREPEFYASEEVTRG